MKCYNCGQNEADDRLLVNYMGHAGEVYLCSACLHSFKQYASSILQEAWRKSTASAQPYAWPNFEMRLPEDQTPDKQNHEHFPLDAGEDIKLKRRLTQLKEELKSAVKAEDYESAATIRDEIYRIEKEVCVQ
ncbi:MAG: UvrB/UvrC motif-containing protein [Oscillospiraceae bacterium]|nr:UvrB/UvrC motif-containing protein [Oscillospiraceae bacterium]